MQTVFSHLKVNEVYMRSILQSLFLVCLFSAQLIPDEIRQNNVSLREGSGAYYPVIKVLQSGEDLEILEKGETWCRVKTRDAITGFVPARAFDPLHAGINYGVLAGQTADRDISKTLVSAAVKGFFEFSADNDRVNRDVMRQPFRRYFQADDYRRFILDTYRDTPWDHEKYMRKIRLPKEAELVADQDLIASSVYIAGRLTVKGLIADRQQLAYVNLIAQLITESTGLYDLPVTVLVAETDEVFANSTPAGIIILSTGMLKNIRSEHEMACLLGHEIAHVTLGHGMIEKAKRKPKMRSEDAFDMLDAEFAPEEFESDLESIAEEMFERSIKGRKQEYEGEADRLGSVYAARAGYDPLGMVAIMERLEPQMKKGRDIDDPTHWFPYSFGDRKEELTRFYEKNLEKRSPKYVTHQERWNRIMY